MITEQLFTLFIILSLVGIFGIIKNKKKLSITCICFGMIIFYLEIIGAHVYYNYKESSWERLTDYISKEIKNGNSYEVHEGIEHVRDNYSEFYTKDTYMGGVYKEKIKEKIKKKKGKDLTSGSTE